MYRWRGITCQGRKGEVGSFKPPSHSHIKAGPEPIQTSTLSYNVLSSVAKNNWKAEGKPITWQRARGWADQPFTRELLVEEVLSSEMSALFPALKNLRKCRVKHENKHQLLHWYFGNQNRIFQFCPQFFNQITQLFQLKN